MEDTICAISTALGVGAISIIRVSGKEAINIVNKIFKGKDLTKVSSHTINYGHIILDKKIIDEVLVSVMKAPKTYTTEDIIEINLHGGIQTTNKVLEILLNNGCRLAEPGEFTKRAFLNGRIDLIKAEAVMDLINAEGENARKLSMNQLNGQLSDIINNIKEKILKIESKIEVNIDYPEYEDLEDMNNDNIIIPLEEISQKLNELINESKNGKLIKSGVNVAIVGEPNVGKSSILNYLIDEDKAIVTDIAGTTRDIIEGKIILNGFVINFIDTAGIRETDDTVEKIGVDKSIKTIDTADIVILVLNNNKKLSTKEKELIDLLKTTGKQYILFINKNDLPQNIDIKESVIYGNTIEKNGLESLKKEIISKINIDTKEKNDFNYLSNARQLSLIQKAKQTLDSAITCTKNNVPVDLIQIDLRRTREFLNACLGETFDEELINELFSNFCLGK